MAAFFTTIAPLIFLTLYIGIIIIIRGKIPDADILLSTLEELYKTVGYPLIFASAIAEGTFLLGLYVPGSAAVLLGAALAKTGVVAFPLVYILGTLGLLVGFVINYFLGRYGWYHVLSRFGLEKGIDEAKQKIEKYDARAILVGYFFPGTASFLSTAAGVLRMPFQKFLLASLAAQSFWSLLWGSLAYFFGQPLVEFLLKNFGFVVVAIVAVWVIRKYFRK